jgi:hypothetical protein
MKRPQRTPTPWRADRQPNGKFLIVSAEGIIAHVGDLSHDAGPNVEGNAAFIVRACNAYDALQLSCRELLFMVEHWKYLSGDFDRRGTLERARNAIAGLSR